ncbi:hypothetical protein AFLA_006420 [Aspergillus flavus NRRL3357]|nr:hypothetical protein AFLA_006420 [Aspergillus flavus NRRL3357]
MNDVPAKKTSCNPNTTASAQCDALKELTKPGSGSAGPIIQFLLVLSLLLFKGPSWPRRSFLFPGADVLMCMP